MYGSALTAHPGWSQGRPITNASSQLIDVTTACPPSVLQAPLSRSPEDYASRLTADTTEASNGIPDTNPLERLNKEVKRRADVVGIFPNEASIIRLIGAVLLEQNDEWQLQHRYMQVEAMAELLAPANVAGTKQIAAAA